jgi:hypothetical protein
MLNILNKLKENRKEIYLNQIRLILACLREKRSENWITFEEITTLAKTKGKKISFFCFDGCIDLLRLKNKVQKRFNKEKSRCEYKINSQI